MLLDLVKSTVGSGSWGRFAPRYGLAIRLVFACAVVSVALLLVACSGGAAGSQLRGVGIADDGNAYVTFRLPDGYTLEDVIGCDVPEENGMAITVLGGSGTSVAYWSHVDKGGLVAWYGRTCRFSPTATTTTVGGKVSPPGYLMLNGVIEDDEVLDPGDVDALSSQFGIELNL